MKQIYDRFEAILLQEDKTQAIQYASSLLEENTLTIPELYESILGPLLNQVESPNDDERIWREHVRSGIIRSIIEVAYLKLVQIKQQSTYTPLNQQVLITCPAEEYHDIGARMAMDFFEMVGFKTHFTGANTPSRDIINAIRIIQPDYVAISVSNYYHLIKTKTLIETIKQEFPNVKILLGGSAFQSHQHQECMGCGKIIQSYQDIVQLAKEVI